MQTTAQEASTRMAQVSREKLSDGSIAWNVHLYEGPDLVCEIGAEDEIAAHQIAATINESGCWVTGK